MKYIMQQPFAFHLSAAILAFVLAGCDASGGSSPAERIAAKPPIDPLISRALNDPLMSDPDLARRSEANAVLAYAVSSALPVLEAGQQSANEAREAARSHLLEGGAIAALPVAEKKPSGASLAEITDPAQLLIASGAPSACLQGLRNGFEWAASLAMPAAIMPLGMAQIAAGSDGPECSVRVVRYLTAASIEDSLVYHHTLASRAGWRVTLHAEPEAILSARGKDHEKMQVHLRAAQGGINAVDVVYWARR